MRIPKLLALVSCACVLMQGQPGALAQGRFPLSFRGTCYETNSSGSLALKRVTDKTWLQDAAQASGITDLKSLAIVYHTAGSSFGDTIDIIDAKTGVTKDTLFGFYFGEAFGRMAL